MPDHETNPVQNPTKPLFGKTAVVTGAASGIGRAIAIELASRGADVIVHGRSPSAAIESVQAEIKSLGQKTAAIFADFSQQPAFETLIEQAWSFAGQVAIWINNAGGDVLTGQWPSRTLIDKLQYLWQVDVVATLMLSRLAGQKMIESRRDRPRGNSGQFSILNMGWDQAWQGMGGESGELFSTSKGAIMAMTKSLAQSFAPDVRVNCLAPGWIQTKWGESASAYWNARALGESLMARWGTPEDVAKVAAFLCSDDAGFISGQIVPINGGFRFSGQD